MWACKAKYCVCLYGWVRYISLGLFDLIVDSYRSVEEGPTLLEGECGEM